MAKLTNSAFSAAQTNKSKQVPYSREQEKELKLHRIIIAVEIAVIVILVALRWFVGGWWITWDITREDDTVQKLDGSEPTAATGYTDEVAAKFDPNAVEGVPQVDPKLGWSVLNIQEGYNVHVCSVLNADAEGRLPVWFSSESTNTVLVKLRVLDEDGNPLGETGLLKPGEYVEWLQLNEGTRSCAVTVQIMGYAPETLYSAGSVSMANTLVVAN